MKYCTLLLLLTFAFSTTAQQPFIFLTISPGNCLACTKNLTYLKILEKNDIPYYFVFEKKYAEDSLIIKEELMLESYKGQYLWSDSLYRKYTGHKDSEIHLLSSCSNNKISMEINKFDVSMAELMVHKYKEVDTLRFDSDVLNAQISQIFSDNNKIYFKRQLRQDVITCMDIVNNKKRQYVLNDSIVKGNFLSYFGDLKEYETIQLINRPKKNIFHYFNVSNDTLYAVSSHL